MPVEFISAVHTDSGASGPAAASRTGLDIACMFLAPVIVFVRLKSHGNGSPIILGDPTNALRDLK